MPLQLVEFSEIENRQQLEFKDPEFDEEGDFDPSIVLPPSHDAIQKGTLHGSSVYVKPVSQVYRPGVKPETLAAVEHLGQELFRLFNPAQPRSFIAASKDELFVVSEEVAGYRPLPHGESEKFSDGTYKGLGQTLVMAYFLQEADLNSGNIGLDEHGRVVKIDGDYLFVGLQKIPGFDDVCQLDEVKGEELRAFPLPPKTYNWMDFKVCGQQFPESKVLSIELAANKAFKDEVSLAMLKTILLPDDTIRQFVSENYPEKCGGIQISAEEFTSFLLARKKMMLDAALKDKDFQEYLKGDTCLKDIEQFTIDLNSYRSADGRQIFSDKMTQAVKKSVLRLRESPDLFIKFKEEYLSQIANIQENTEKDEAQAESIESRGFKPS